MCCTFSRESPHRRHFSLVTCDLLLLFLLLFFLFFFLFFLLLLLLLLFSAFFDARVCHPNAVSYRELSPKLIFQLHENEKRQYNRRVLEVEQHTPLVFTSTGGMADEFKRFHSHLTELLALKKGDDYATTISWIRAKVSLAILRSALLCLRGTRGKRRAANISDIDTFLRLFIIVISSVFR